VKLLGTLVVLVALLGAGASSAHAASPRIVIISGKPLERQVVISDWGKISQVVAGVAAARVAPRTHLANRPRLTFSMFWGPKWNDYLSSGKSATALRPRQADQSGSFYPAWRGRPALIDLPWYGQWPRPVPASALLILKRYGVPIKLA
jgi:hypothetical protein